MKLAGWSFVTKKNPRPPVLPWRRPQFNWPRRRELTSTDWRRLRAVRYVSTHGVREDGK